MIYHTTLTQKWQMTIPKHVRNVLGLTRPGRIVVAVEPKRKAFMIEQPPSILILRVHLRQRTKKIINAVKIRDYMETHYERT